MTVEGWSWIVLSLVLLAAAGVMMALHARAWRTLQNICDELAPGELDYRRRQFRRRMQTSGLLGLLGLVLFAGQWIESPPFPIWAFALFWALVLVLVFWLGLLALADIVASQYFFGQVRHDYRVAEAKLRYDLKRLGQQNGNGEAD
jgi:hypothetical protein